MTSFKKLYRKYLEGEIFDRTFEQTEYANVTLNLDQYFLNAYIYLQNGTKLHEPYDSSAIQHIETFSGFINSDFVKCFMMIYNGKEQRKVEEVLFNYDKEQLLHEVLDNGDEGIDEFT